ncbi:MAG: hypothetical protein LQ338_004914 [Usnochroma carphineum]|nr:MAG: hypothetical protein LQ338_004914 [Usnochroma carphineum]
MNFDELEQVSFHHPIYDADLTDPDPYWYRESLNTGYEFRLGPRDPDKPQPSCRIDLDESGDYDPSGKHAQQGIPVKRKRETLPQVDDNGEPIQRKPRPWSWQNGRFNGLSLPVTLRLSTERGLALLDRLGNGTDHWPLDDQSSSSSSQDPTFWSGSAQSSSSSLPVYDEEPHMLRRRDRVERDQYHQGDVDDDWDITNVTLGHPAARGCIPCLKLRLPCALLQEEATYPCQDCIEDDCDCELVLEPSVKRSCEGCRRRRIRCSYLDSDSDHKQACRTCFCIGVKCIAGPASGRTRTGPSLDQLALYNPTGLTKSRLFVTCTQCRQAKQWCSLTKDRDGPCNRCIANDIPCTFEALPKSIKAAHLYLRNHQKALQAQSSIIQQELNPALSGSSNPSATQTGTMTTRLPHPIQFNHEPHESCSWCLDLLHGLLGYGTVHPLVRDTPSGYIEISGGHRSQGYLPSRMCVSCTLDRFQILGCEAHELQTLEGVNSEGFDPEVVMEALMAGTVSDVEWEWCCVCPNPAVFRCGRAMEGFDGEDGEAGCGLRLCEECAITMAMESGGDLEGLIEKKMKEAEGEEGLEYTVRADAEFLLRKGELLRRAALVEEEG